MHHNEESEGQNNNKHDLVEFPSPFMRPTERKQSVGEEFLVKSLFNTNLQLEPQVNPPSHKTPSPFKNNKSAGVQTSGNQRHPSFVRYNTTTSKSVSNNNQNLLTELFAKTKQEIDETLNNHPDFLKKATNYVFLESKRLEYFQNLSANVLPVSMQPFIRSRELHTKFSTLLGGLSKIISPNQEVGPVIDDAPFQTICMSMLQFWLECFKNMKSEMEKYTEAYTLVLFKQLQQDKITRDRPNVIEENAKKDRLTLANLNYDNIERAEFRLNIQEVIRKNRRPWTANETKILQNLVSSQVSLSNQQLHELSTRFGRSIVSVQTKIQRVSERMRKSTGHSLGTDESPLEKKVHAVLDKERGLTKEEILNRLEERFEMGRSNTWRKSVAQIICISKHIVKCKGQFVLHQDYIIPKKKEKSDQARQSMKEKSLCVLRKMHNHRANIQTIAREYSEKYDVEYTRGLELRIHKTLCKCKKEVQKTKNTYRYSQSAVVVSKSKGEQYSGSEDEEHSDFEQSGGRREQYSDGDD